MVLVGGVSTQVRHPLPSKVDTPRESSTVSTCYVAGGMHLTFTQEDFLVFKGCFLKFSR